MLNDFFGFIHRSENLLKCRLCWFVGSVMLKLHIFVATRKSTPYFRYMLHRQQVWNTPIDDYAREFYENMYNETRALLVKYSCYKGLDDYKRISDRHNLARIYKNRARLTDLGLYAEMIIDSYKNEVYAAKQAGVNVDALYINEIEVTNDCLHRN